MRTGTFARATALSGAALLALTACGGSSDSGDTGGGASSEKQVNLYGTDGNVGNALGESFTEKGALQGLKGTTPLTKLSSDFKDRLLAVDPQLKDFNYSAESYDAVTITALAAAMAQSNDATVFGAYVNGVTFGGDKCTDFTSCIAIIAAGGNPDYDGVTGPLAFADPGEPAVASFGVLQFGADNKLDDSLTDYLTVGDEANAATNEGPAAAAYGTATAPFKFGTLLPLTGSLAYLGPPEVAGVQLAVNDINAAGGLLGSQVEIVSGDSGDTSTNIATQTVATLLQQGVNAIIGAASSDVTKTVIDTVTQAGVLQFSPANTSDSFTTYADNGLYFRTAPPDLFQGQVLADLVSQDGNQSVGILAQNGEYGTGLAEQIVKNLDSAGLSGDSVKSVYYDPTASDFSDIVQQMVDFNPDAIVVVGFDESAKIIKGLNEQGIGPKR
ncbi:MAG: ABC-type branched-chain amino acid transport system, Extracellular ligand-binding receptor [Blastococcus sp.]|nr:ABC-type branched-chain amino acid transport system, Extracellular ligand-binding receptor [Blastococcus sp.]